MGTEANKELVRQFFEHTSKNEFDAALDLMADSATYWVAGHPEEHPGSGTLTKAQYGTLVSRVPETFPDGMVVRPTAFTAEGDRVAVEANLDVRTKDGKPYTQQYHYLFEIRDGKIQAVRMYLDTLHVKTVLSSS
jgi:ketosteroid isomerase-like protein